MSIPGPEQITAVVLAGGQGRRMGGRDKGLVAFAGRPMVAHVVAALRPQTGRLLINANRNAPDYAAFGYPVQADAVSGFEGPLAGMASAMAAVDTPWIVTAPCDCPFIDPALVPRLAAAVTGPETLAVAHDGERLQPVFALLPVTLRADLEAFLAAGERKIDRWYARHAMVPVDFSDNRRMFDNLNTPEDLREAEAALAR